MNQTRRTIQALNPSRLTSTISRVNKGYGSIIAAVIFSLLVSCGTTQPITQVSSSAAPTSEINAFATPTQLSNPVISSVTPAQGSIGAPAGTNVTLQFTKKVEREDIVRSFVLLPGLFGTTPTQPLNLTAMCNGYWRVRNPNGQPFVFTWDVYSNKKDTEPEDGLNGSGIVPAGNDVFFSSKDGNRTVRLFVGGVQQSIKASNTGRCADGNNGQGNDSSEGKVVTPKVPTGIAGKFVWAADSKSVTFTPVAPLPLGQSFTVFVGFMTKPFASVFTTGQPIVMTSANPTSFKNDVTTDVTVTGQGFNAQSTFFIQSNKLDVVSVSPSQTVLRIPAGFLPSVYGLMAVNQDGSRTTLYPAFTIQKGADPTPINPLVAYQSYVQGYVINFATNAPIAGAKVSIPGLETTTTPNGYYLLRGVPQGRNAVRIEADGFEPVYRIAETNQAAKTLTMKLAELQPFDTKTTLIGPAGGRHDASDGSYLVVPPGALDRDVPIQFTHLDAANTLPELPQDGSYLAFAHLGPTGLVFKKPATLFLPLQPGIQLTNGQRISISYYDARQARWVDDITSGVISTINGKQFLEYEINHFTWIGGRWASDTVSGQVLYDDGSPAANITTNYGVTDAAGQYQGSVTQSASSRILTANIPNGALGTLNVKNLATIYSVSKPYSGNETVSFPNLVIPKPATNNFSIRVDGEKTNCSAAPTVNGASLQKKYVVIIGGGGPNTPVDTKHAMSVVFDGQTAWNTNLDPTTLKVTFGGVDYTPQMKIDTVFSKYTTSNYDVIHGELYFTKPPVTGLGIDVKVTAKTWSGESLGASIKVNIIERLAVPTVKFFSFPDAQVSPILQTPYQVTGTTEDQISVIFKDSDTIPTNYSINLPVTAYDKDGEILPINSADISPDKTFFNTMNCDTNVKFKNLTLDEGTGSVDANYLDISFGSSSNPIRTGINFPDDPTGTYVPALDECNLLLIPPVILYCLKNSATAEALHTAELVLALPWTIGKDAQLILDPSPRTSDDRNTPLPLKLDFNPYFPGGSGKIRYGKRDGLRSMGADATITSDMLPRNCPRNPYGAVPKEFREAKINNFPGYVPNGYYGNLGHLIPSRFCGDGGLYENLTPQTRYVNNICFNAIDGYIESKVEQYGWAKLSVRPVYPSGGNVAEYFIVVITHPVKLPDGSYGIASMRRQIYNAPEEANFCKTSKFDIPKP